MQASYQMPEMTHEMMLVSGMANLIVDALAEAKRQPAGSSAASGSGNDVR